MKFFLLPVAALAIGLGGCVDDNTLSYSIDRVIAINRANNCMPTPGSTVIVANGIYDVGLATQGIGSPGFSQGYEVAPLVVNHLLERTMLGTIETDSIDITGFDVELKLPKADARLATALPANLQKFFIPRAGGRITPGSMGNVIIVEVIPIDLAKALNATLMSDPNNMAPTAPITVHMRPVGNRAGLSINGGYIDFPVQICRYCLSTPVVCPTGGFPMGTGAMEACLPAQDDSSTCCTQNNQLLCGAAVPTKTGM